MLAWTWMAGVVRRRRARLAATAGGAAIAVALLCSLGCFLAASQATMTTRAVGRVAVDWQVQVQPGTDLAAVLAGVGATPGVAAEAPVEFAATSGLEARTGGSTQHTGPGMVLGLPDGYASTFPGELRALVGAPAGALLAQQTASNLHAAPGDTVSVGRAGLPAVTIRVDGVVELPQADALFQTVGASRAAAPQAPPDNVVLLPATQWHALFDPLASARPDLIHTQVHVRLSHHLPPDPGAAFAAVVGRARNLEVRLAGGGVVGDNLAATLDGARSDAVYAEVLFVFLGLPGVALAGLLTAAVAGAGAARRRQEQALLRARGVSQGVLVRLAALEAVAVGLVGSLVGLAAAAGVGVVAFGTARFGATPWSTALWATFSAVTGVAIAVSTIAVPAWRDARRQTVAAGRQGVGRGRSPRWLRFGLDGLLLAAGGVVFWLAGRGGYHLVLVPEGVPTISVSYWVFAAPALLWVGAGLLAWRVGDLGLGRGTVLTARLVRPLAGRLSGTIAASMRRQRRIVARTLVLVALTSSFAASTAIFNATYRQQSAVDARLTNGADVNVTEPPGAVVGPAEATRLATVPGARSVEPLQHRFAYVGPDLQDLFGVRPSTVVGATRLQDAYFHGGSARQLIGRLAAQPDAILVSAETARDFQLNVGDQLRLRLQDRGGQYVTVTFHYAGVVTEFPTAPRDSFLLANADYVARMTGSDAVGAFLIDTAGASPAAVAARARALLGTGPQITDVTTTRRIVGSSLTAVDLAGLTRVELGFALALAAASTGLMLGLGVAERRRTLALAAALGATARQLSAFVWSEAVYVTGGGLAAGALTGWMLSAVLVRVLTGVFDPPPAALAVPWSYLGAVVGVAVAAVAVAALAAVRSTRRPPIAELRAL